MALQTWNQIWKNFLICYLFCRKTNWPRFQFQGYLFKEKPNMPFIVMVVLLKFGSDNEKLVIIKCKPNNKNNYERKLITNRLISKSWNSSTFPTLSSNITLIFNGKGKWGNSSFHLSFVKLLVQTFWKKVNNRNLFVLQVSVYSISFFFISWLLVKHKT